MGDQLGETQQEPGWWEVDSLDPLVLGPSF